MRIYFIYWTLAHLLKTSRNTFFKDYINASSIVVPFIIDWQSSLENDNISFEDIETLYVKDKINLYGLTKLTDNHSYLDNYQKIKVEYCTQILS